MLCLRLLSLHNALRRTALQHGCEIKSGAACKGVHPISGGGGSKRAALILSHEGAEEEEVVKADFVVGADGLKSVVRAFIGGERCRGNDFMMGMRVLFFYFFYAAFIP